MGAFGDTDQGFCSVNVSVLRGIDTSGSTHLVRGDAGSLFAYAIGDSDASRKRSAFEDDA